MRSVPLILLISLCTFAAFADEIRELNLQNQFIGAACNVKRWLRLLAQQSSRTEGSQNPSRRNERQRFRFDPNLPTRFPISDFYFIAASARSKM